MTLLDYLSTQAPAFIVTCLLFGLLVGSFLNVVIYRLPEMMRRQWRKDCHEFLASDSGDEKFSTHQSTPQDEEKFNLVTPGSHCPSCNTTIRPWENIPILSFLLMRGRCANCNVSISWQYPAVEFITGLLAMAVAWQFGFSLAAGFALIFTFALVALAGIDFKTQLLPDSITIPLLWLGLIAGLFEVFVSLQQAVIGALVGYLSFWLIYQLFFLITRREGMGMGDLKLLAALGAWLGWEQLPIIILCSSVAGSIFGIIAHFLADRSTEENAQSTPFAFGPFLAIAGLISLHFGQPLSAAIYGL